MLNLNIGSGGKHLKNFVSLDLQKIEGVDIVCNVKQRLPFDDDSVDKMFCSHLIEHFWWEDVPSILATWFPLLKQGGVLELWTVDFELVIRNFHEQKNMEYVNWRLYNMKRARYDEHQGTFSYPYLKQILLKIGFKHVERVNVEEFPFTEHKDINMGVRAVK